MKSPSSSLQKDNTQHDEQKTTKHQSSNHLSSGAAKLAKASGGLSALNSEKAGGVSGLSDAKTHPTKAVKTKKEDKDKKDKDAENNEPWWPPFQFDGRNALKSKLVLNLRNCQYDLFKTIAIEELKWRVIDNRCNVLDPVPNSTPQNGKSAQNNTEDEDEASTGDNSSAQNQKEQVGMSKERQKVENLQYRLVRDHDLNNWDIFWADSGMTPEFLSSLSNTQRVNHYLGMYNICRKSTLGMHLKRFQKEFPEHYNFFPQTWMWPAEFHDILEYHKKKTEKRKIKVEEGKMTEAQSETDPIALYICKPESGSQGRGIFISQKVEDMRIQLNKTYEKNRENMNEYLKVEQGLDTLQIYVNPNNQAERDKLMERQQEKPQNLYIVQKYIKRPALYQGHKYDFRIYVLITSVLSPMTIFLFNDGLVRLASEKYDYSKSYDDPFVHLTNYSLNKNNKEFDSQKHKLRLKDVLVGELVSTSQTGKTYRKTAKQIWHEIEQIVVKTVFVVQPQLQHLYRTSQAKEPDLCCDLLGFDVMLDHKLKPWMLEVNHMPSFKADTDIDYDIKHDLILDTLQILQLGIEQRRQMDVILKQEQKQAMQYGNVKRMTVREHSERVRFDQTLIDQYLPNNNFKRIYPLDPGTGGLATNGDELEDFYVKLEKSAQTVWKKQVGMIQKTTVNPNIHENVKKKKRKKNQKGLLTSMTSHIKDPKTNQDEEQEEGPEDGEDDGIDEVDEINDTTQNEQTPSKQRRDSAMSVGTEGTNYDKKEQGGDLRHIVSNSNYRRSNLTNNRQQFNQNQSQSSLSKNSNLRSTNNINAQRGIMANRASAFNTFVPPTNPNLHYGNQNRLMNQLKKNEQLASKSIQEELKNLPAHHPVPTLNEILTQLHQDPGFRQRYKEYCRAVLDGRFSFGGIKNPIYDHIYGGNPAIQQTNHSTGHQNAYNLSYQNTNKPGVFYDHQHIQNNMRQQQAGFSQPGSGHVSMTNNGGVTLLAQQTLRNQHLKQAAQPYFQHQMQHSAAAGTQSKRGKLETIPHQQVPVGGPVAQIPSTTSQNSPGGMTGQANKAFTSSSNGPTISEAAYFIQRVNKILQNQGDEQPGQQNASSGSGAIQNNTYPQLSSQQVSHPGYAFKFANNSSGQHNIQQQHSSQSQIVNQLNSQHQGTSSRQNIQGQPNNPYMGIAIQSVNQAQNGNNIQIMQDSQTQGLMVQQSQSVGNGQYAHTLKQMQNQHSGQRAIQSNTDNRNSSHHNGSHVNDQLNSKMFYQKNNNQKISQSQSAQKSINKIQSLQNQNIGPLSSSGQKQQHNNHNNQQENPTLQKTVIDLIKNTVTQHPGQKLNSIQMKKQNAAITNQSQIPLTFQQQQILNNLSSNQPNKQRISQRQAYREASQETEENMGMISSAQMHKKQNYNNGIGNISSNDMCQNINQTKKTEVKTPVQQQNKMKITQTKASSSLSSHIISKTPPFNQNKQQEFENMKRQLQNSKGIGGINSNIDANENLATFNSQNGYSPGIPQQRAGLKAMNGNGPIKVMQMSMNNMDSKVLNKQAMANKNNVNYSSNNFINVNSASTTNNQFERINRINSLQKNDYPSGNIYDEREVASKGSRRQKN